MGEASQKKRAKAKAAKERKQQTEDSETGDLPLKTPNATSCWYYTNGLQCPKKFLDASGTCKYAGLHKFCGMPLKGGGFCEENHKATEHKQ